MSDVMEYTSHHRKVDNRDKRWPFILVDLGPGDGALARWVAEHDFDDVPKFRFEARRGTPRFSRLASRTIQLIIDGNPCSGSQWTSTIEDAERNAAQVVTSYVYAAMCRREAKEAADRRARAEMHRPRYVSFRDSAERE